MVSITANIADIQQSFMNNITQDDQQNCTAVSTSTTNDNVVIVNGANIGGDFTGVSNTTTTDASCLMVSNMEDSVADILSATIAQTNTSETDWFNDFEISEGINEFNLTQTVTNNISQINQATCSANTTISSNNNYVYLTNADIGGNFVGVTSSSSAAATCSMNNIMKNTTYNQAQANTSQSNTMEGMFVAMVAAFASVVGLIVIAVIILFAVGALGFVGYEATSSHKSSSGAPPAPEPEVEAENQELAEADQLGLSPEVLSSLSSEE